MSTIRQAPNSPVNARLPQDSQVPWSPEASSAVRGLRRAITAHRADAPVDAEVAAMMPSMLARLNTLTGPASPPTSLQPPTPPNPVEPPSPEATMRTLGQVSASLHKSLQGADDGPQSQRLSNLLRVLDQHLDMKQEVVLRASAHKL